MIPRASFHEDYHPGDSPRIGSDRAFGIVFTIVFAIWALLPVLDGRDVKTWAGAVSISFLAFTLFCPTVLKPLNRLWYRFGLLLHRVVSPLIVAFLFFLTVTPIGLLMRILGKDPLRLKFDHNAPTYWIKRDVSSATPETMRRQF